jgi:hypothetical protein
MYLSSHKKMMFALCACLVLPFIAIAQTDFRKGFIITHEKDTVLGLINFHDGTRAFEVCYFKRSDNEDSRSYSPADIVGYGFLDGRRYVTKTIVLKEATETVFLEVLAYGRISLYRYRDVFWVEKEGSGLIQLRDEPVEYEKDRQKYIVHSNEHIATLNMLMADCDKVRSAIQEVPLYQRQLVVLVESYNNCQKKEAKADRSAKPWIKLIPGISGGVGQSRIDVSEMNVVFRDDVIQNDKMISPVFGLSLDISAPRISERFMFTTSLLYAPSTYYITSAFNRSYQQYVLIDINALKLPVGVRYTFAPRVVTPFFNVGFSTNIHLDSSSSWTTESTANNVVETFNRGSLPLKSTQLGFWGGLGVLIRLSKKIDTLVEFRYERTDGFVHMHYFGDYSSKVTNLQLLLGLRMNKIK